TGSEAEPTGQKTRRAAVFTAAGASTSTRLASAAIASSTIPSRLSAGRSTRARAHEPPGERDRRDEPDAEPRAGDGAVGVLELVQRGRRDQQRDDGRRD